LLADLGYRGVALTPDVGQLDPYRLDSGEVARIARLAGRLDLALAVETGARFLLDARRKHHPSLLSEDAADRARRVDFLGRSIDLAVELGAPLVSLWAGAAPGGVVGDAPGGGEADAARTSAAWEHLTGGLLAVLEHAHDRGVQLAFEPEPGMFLERPAGYLELRRRLGSAGEALGLCLDVGHLLVTGDRPEAQVVRALAPHLVHVHLDDIADGRHEHLPFGRGDLDLPGVLAALLEVGYGGMAAVELSRDSHRGAQAAAEALAALRAAWPTGGASARP
jgi:L-ribulose-5-phosphate 3-epimerase